jgi:hypothetical protein
MLMRCAAHPETPTHRHDIRSLVIGERIGYEAAAGVDPPTAARLQGRMVRKAT